MIYKKINTENDFNVDEEMAQEFIDHRINIKKPLTQGAFNRAMKAAHKCLDLGISSNEAIEITCDKGWQGVTYEYISAELARRRQALSVGAGSTRNTTLQEDLNSRDWAH